MKALTKTDIVVFWTLVVINFFFKLGLGPIFFLFEGIAYFLGKYYHNFKQDLVANL